MANVIVLNPKLYTDPPKTAIPGARRVYRSMAVTAAQLSPANIFAIAVLPAGHRLGDFVIESTDIDTFASMTLNVGLLNCYYSSSPNPNIASPALASPLIISASTVGQAGGYARPGSTLTPMTSQDVDASNDRIVAVQVVSPAGSPAAGTIAVSFDIDID